MVHTRCRFSTETPPRMSRPQPPRSQYAQVGAHIVTASHVLIALWDGAASESTGGTAQIVRFRAFGVPREYLSEYSQLDAPDTGIVYHVYAPRRGEAGARQPGDLRRLRAGIPTPEDPWPFFALDSDKPDPFDPIYQRIEAFNSDALLIHPRSAPPGRDRKRSATQELRDDAEQTANHYQILALRALKRLFLTTAAAAILLSCYSHIYRTTFVLVLPYALFVILAVFIYVNARRSKWQDKSQDYRALEIGLAVQHVWDRVGLDKSVGASYLRRQRTGIGLDPRGDTNRSRTRSWRTIQ